MLSVNTKVLSNAKKLEQEKVKRVQEYRAQITKKISMANKRLRRLEKAGLTDSPAYQRLVKDGKPQFSIKGKDYRQVQQEEVKLNRYLDSLTSTVTGTTKHLKTMAKNVGIKYDNMKQLQADAKIFFELDSKAKQYLRNVEDMGSAIGYQAVWKEVNTVMTDFKHKLDGSRADVEEMLKAVTDALMEHDKPKFISDDEDWFTLE